MSITDELRGYANGYELYVNHKLLAIADRIDAEHKRMYDDLTVGMEPMTEESMAGHGWVKLPVDADGQVWTGKERVFVADNGSRYDMRYLMYDGNDWLIDSSSGGFPVGCCRHVQPDNWERIVRCRDCEHFVLGSNDYATVDWCDYWESALLSQDGFCAWGERKVVE